MTKILKFIANLLLIIAIVALSGYFLLRVTNRIEIYNVKTGSMEAKIHVGDYILILKEKSYDVGDVVTYTSNNGFITHRIIKIDGDKVTTKGDANNTEDETISSKIIIGKVIMSGGILNIVINYKYVISGIVLSLYLFSCYFESAKGEETKNNNDEINDDEENETEIENDNSEEIHEKEDLEEIKKDDEVVLEKKEKVKKSKT